MTRPALTLTQRRARRAIAEHIVIFMEELLPTPLCPYPYKVTAECSLCDHGCSMSFTGPKKSLSAYVGAFAGAFYSLCVGLDTVLEESDCAVPDGQNQAISGASED